MISKNSWHRSSSHQQAYPIKIGSRIPKLNEMIKKTSTHKVNQSMHTKGLIVKSIQPDKVCRKVLIENVCLQKRLYSVVDFCWYIDQCTRKKFFLICYVISASTPCLNQIYIWKDIYNVWINQLDERF